MTDAPAPTDATAAFRASVERHLADLPADIRDDLIAGLRTHLTEVASELGPGERLEHRLGSAEQYASELRETVELQHVSAAHRLRRTLGDAADRYTESAGVGPAAEFAASLRPGWWVLRGLLAAMLVGYWALVADEGVRHTLLEFAGVSASAGLVLAIALVWFSLRLGARSRHWSPLARKWVAAGGVALAAVGAWCLFSVLVDFTPLSYYAREFLSAPGIAAEDGGLAAAQGGG